MLEADSGLHGNGNAVVRWTNGPRVSSEEEGNDADRTKARRSEIVRWSKR